MVKCLWSKTNVKLKPFSVSLCVCQGGTLFLSKNIKTWSSLLKRRPRPALYRPRMGISQKDHFHNWDKFRDELANASVLEPLCWADYVSQPETEYTMLCLSRLFVVRWYFQRGTWSVSETKPLQTAYYSLFACFGQIFNILISWPMKIDH